jgi:hypothetical protein
LVFFNETGVITSVNEENDTHLPENFFLLQNYPNSFNPITTISYQLPSWYSGMVKLKVYDISGREVATLVNEEQPPGHYKMTFDAAGFASGIYLYKLQTEKFSEIKKMVLAR